MAMHNLGCNYRDGKCGYQQDYTKALELFHWAAELGYSEAINSIGTAYYNGRGVEVDNEKAVHYYELAAMRGDVEARYNLGIEEENARNFDRALKHYIIAIGVGDSYSLMEIQDLYSKGHATKEDYTKALRSYQEYLVEIKSKQRDEAAADHEEYRYY